MGQVTYQNWKLKKFSRGLLGSGRQFEDYPGRGGQVAVKKRARFGALHADY